VQSIPPKLLDVIMTKAQGNPFLAEQIATNLKEQDMFRIVFSQIVMEADVDLSKVSIPDTIQDVMLSRIDRYNFSVIIIDF
jgi:predicted ATPase